MSTLQEEEALGKAYDSRLMRRLLQYLKPYRWRVVLALALVAVVTPLELAPPAIFQKAIDNNFVPAMDHKIAESSAWIGIIWLSLLYLAVLAFDFLAQYIQIRIMQRVGQQTMYDMRREIFGHLQRLPMSYFDRHPVGRLVTRVTTDVDALNDLFAAGVVTMINDFFLLVVMAALLFKLDRRLALDTLAILPGILIVTLIFRKYVRDANRRIRIAIARINAFLQEYISGMSVVQLFNREKKAMEEFSKRNRDNMLAWRDAILAYALFYPAVEFLSFATIALIYWSGGNRILHGALTLGVLTEFTMYAQRFFRPIQDLSEKFNILQSAMAASERIFKLLDEPVTIQSDPNAITLVRPHGEIEFRNVWFSYRNVREPSEEDWVLRDVSFRVEPGQTFAIVGHTGAGKTTLISLLLRFYDIQRGQILLDGKDIRTIELQDLRRQFGIVLQDPFLFTGTIAANVRLGTPNIDTVTVERALEEVGLGDFIRSLSEGPATNVNERGSTLSVGQRPRAGAQSALPDSRRGHLQRRHQDGVADSRGIESPALRAHRTRHRPPPQHHPARGSHPRLSQRALARARCAPGASPPARYLFPPLSAPVQRAGAAHSSRSPWRGRAVCSAGQRLIAFFAAHATYSASALRR